MLVRRHRRRRCVPGCRLPRHPPRAAHREPRACQPGAPRSHGPSERSVRLGWVSLRSRGALQRSALLRPHGSREHSLGTPPLAGGAAWCVLRRWPRLRYTCACWPAAPSWLCAPVAILSLLAPGYWLLIHRFSLCALCAASSRMWHTELRCSRCPLPAMSRLILGLRSCGRLGRVGAARDPASRRRRGMVCTAALAAAALHLCTLPHHAGVCTWPCLRAMRHCRECTCFHPSPPLPARDEAGRLASVAACGMPFA